MPARIASTNITSGRKAKAGLALNPISPEGGATGSTLSTLFDGATQYGNAGTALNSKLEYNVNWSVSAWLKISSGTGSIALLSNSDPAAPDFQGAYLAYGQGGQSLDFQMISAWSTNNRERWTSGSSIYTPGSWFHMLFVWNTTSAQLWINNSAVTLNETSGHSLTGSVDSGLNLGVGGHYIDSSPAQHWDGNIDDLAIWTSDESANRAAIYNGGETHDLSQLASAPAHWWKCGDGDAAGTWTDNIGSADVTLTGSPTYATDVP